MSKMKYLVASGIIVAAVAATPLFIASGIDQKVEETKVKLESHGLKQEIISKVGYLNTTRTFTLEVVDAQKVRDFLLEALVEKNPQYKLFAQNMKRQTRDEINEAFNGIKFKGEMTNSNLLASDTTVSLALSSLSTSLQNELAQEKVAADAILPLLNRGVFAADMVFGSDEKLKSFKLKDIKEELKLEAATLSLDMGNQMLDLSESGGVITGKASIGKQAINLHSKSVNFSTQLDNFNYGFTYKDDLNNKGDLSIDKYAFVLEEPYSTTKLSFGPIKALSSVEDVAKSLHVKADYRLNMIAFADSVQDSLNIEKLGIKLVLEGINSDTMKKIQQDYNTLLISGATSVNDKVIIDDFVALINNGITITLNVAMQNITGIMTLKDIGVDVTLTIPKNSYSDKQSPLELVGLLDITSRIKVHKEDKQTLETLSGSTPEMNYGRAEGDFFIYDIVMKKGEVTINGKAIQ
ncbi:MAG: hypothetical protein PHR87_01400 [Sulfurospirillaceae bacterium]|nr:hypothetical protein [Sulfurospirillaceae bacterium]